MPGGGATNIDCCICPLVAAMIISVGVHCSADILSLSQTINLFAVAIVVGATSMWSVVDSSMPEGAVLPTMADEAVLMVTHDRLIDA